eukprot:scaffold207_cov409-Prasinococcus_capsulatus_cf.AAC.84
MHSRSVRSLHVAVLTRPHKIRRRSAGGWLAATDGDPSRLPAGPRPQLMPTSPQVWCAASHHH